MMGKKLFVTLVQEVGKIGEMMRVAFQIAVKVTIWTVRQVKNGLASVMKI